MNHEHPRIAIVGTVGLPPRYGGFETLSDYLVTQLSQTFDFTVYCSGPDYKTHPEKHHQARLVYFPFKANGAQSILYDLCNLIHAWVKTDLILVLGVSGGIFLPIGRLVGKKVVLNIGGLDWQRSKWGPIAAWFLRISEWVAVRAAHVLVADNAGIAAYLKQKHGLESHLIAYGGDQACIPEGGPLSEPGLPPVGTPYAFSVARIQPDNHVETILQAFERIEKFPLVFVGDWERSEYGRTLRERYRLHPRLHLLDAIYDRTRLNKLRGHCNIYVHGHSAGGTNPSLVEAMYLGLPIAAYDVVYNRATTNGQGKFFASVEELIELIQTTADSEWTQLGLAMKEIADRQYKWDIVCSAYSELFRLGGVERHTSQMSVEP